MDYHEEDNVLQSKVLSNKVVDEHGVKLGMPFSEQNLEYPIYKLQETLKTSCLRMYSNPDVHIALVVMRFFWPDQCWGNIQTGDTNACPTSQSGDTDTKDMGVHSGA